MSNVARWFIYAVGVALMFDLTYVAGAFLIAAAIWAK